MNRGKFLEEVEKRRFSIVEVSSLYSDLVTFLDEVSELPIPWMVKYFDKAEELLNFLSSKEATKQKKVVGVTPSDLNIPIESFSTAAYKSQIQLLIIVGRAYRSHEDRNRRFYLRR